MATARIHDRQFDGQPLTFTLDGGEPLTDEETGSRWDPLRGIATSGPLLGKNLPACSTSHSMWFVWKEYRPDTELAD